MNRSQLGEAQKHLQAGAPPLEACLLLTSQRAASATPGTAVIDFALEDFMTLLEIIKRTNVRFLQTKSTAFFFPPVHGGNLPFF